MRFLNIAVRSLYRIAAVAITLFALSLLVRGNSVIATFHLIAPYFPVIASCFVLGIYNDLLQSILAGKTVDLRARMIDFVHWLLLIPIMVSNWLTGSASVMWFMLQLLVLALIGAGIGAQWSRKGQALSRNEKFAALIGGIAALALGSFTAFMRTMDSEPFGYGWLMDSVTAVASTVFVMGFIRRDLIAVRKDHSGYPRAMFYKGIFGCNVFILLLWLHVMSRGDMSDPSWWAQNLGLCFNTLVGNVIYLGFYFAYEHYRSVQERRLALNRT